MTLEEEKKLVAEKLMGWQIGVSRNEGSYFEWNKSRKIYVADWNPQSEREWWDQIWDNMGDKLFEDYYHNKLWAIQHSTPVTPTESTRLMHAAKPEICWKALIKTLDK